MLAAVTMQQSVILSLFLPTIVIYFGLGLVLANASTLAMSQVSDKAQSSAVMSFINMGLTTVVVLSLGFVTMNTSLLPCVFITLNVAMIGLFRALRTRQFP